MTDDEREVLAMRLDRSAEPFDGQAALIRADGARIKTLVAALRLIRGWREIDHENLLLEIERIADAALDAVEKTDI